ncbi:hypothetical protein GCM10011579_005350 [Streptomyces albiflavescens]|uniref:biotin carboxylase n=1 Tax=Streptomyces albiflavescens TaxID=1623582 RepID=A0A917XRU7_9ACTN|nr:hypothetical protein GCM10011579_005350 [Streptomyces albiflavescens]
MGAAAVLVANRGEIAVRVLRAASELGLRTVAVYADGDDPHARRADETVPLKDYLDAEAIVAAARNTGCAFLHPGYGFLSEDADFARRCAAAGITFVGPSPEVLDLFGDKARARALAVRLEVPVLPGTEGATTLDEAREFLAGGAVMIKAIGGGGGRGMRVVRSDRELTQAWERCRSEARQGFGRGELYVERLLEGARHIEVQIVGDATGAVTHLWERDCSAQRRHQKLIEIAPAPELADSTREKLLSAALRMARATHYTGLGTFEFLVRGQGEGGEKGEEFHFIEANPRLQVEHTVTEEVTGVDLVAVQLRLAAGETLESLGLAGPPPAPRGFAVQARVNAEVTSADGTVRPSAGRLTRFDVPTGPGVRVDTAMRAGTQVGVRYDSLLAKVIAHVPHDFAAACERARRALGEFGIEGVRTGIPLLRAVLDRPGFWKHTGIVEEYLAELPPEDEQPTVVEGTVSAPMSGTVVSIAVAPGEPVCAGEQLLVLEAMKMEHVILAPVAGVVGALYARVGETVGEGHPLLELGERSDATAEARPDETPDLDAMRPDLAEAVRRHAVGLDGNRPEAVAKRHAIGRRTARENIQDLCDEGTFTEFGALAIAAQRQRRTLDDLIRSTPADGMVTGTGRVGGGAVRGDVVRLHGARGHAGVAEPPQDRPDAGAGGGTAAAGRAVRGGRRRSPR